MIFEKLENFPTPKSDLEEIRAKWISKASGATLEMGFGTGLNLPFYTNLVKELVGVDIVQDFTPPAQRRINRFPLPFGFVNGNLEKIPFKSETIDTLVLTWALCCVDDVETAINEMKRVLKPDGKLIFIEHGLAPSKIISKLQSAWSPVQKKIAAGCRVNRNIAELFKKQGFYFEEIEEGYLPGPKVLTYTTRGIARKVE